jgi:modulator of FtsH protease HflK
MSWNESGGNRNGGPRNPWDRKPSGGAPDLDDMVKGLQRRLRELFGGGRREPNEARGGRGGANWAALGALLVAVWAATGFYQVGAAERAIITRFGAFVPPVIGPGPNWHLPWPIESKVLVNTMEFQSFTDRTRMLTQDQAQVDINIAVQYRRRDPYAVVFNVVEPEKTLADASESAIREIIGQSSLKYVLEKGRQDMAAKTKALVQATLDSYQTGLEVISVNLQDVSVPEAVAPSQKEAIKAGEDKDRLRVEAETYANDILPKARGTAQQTLLDAEAYKSQVLADAQGETARFSALLGAYEKAPQVTRERLYLETMEGILRNANKVIIDAKGGGNMFYVPIDKLIDTHTRDAGHGPIPEVTVTPPRTTEAGSDGRPQGGSR